MLRPTDSAAIELSRIAFTALPVLELMKLYETISVIIRSMKPTTNDESFGTPFTPSAPRIISVPSAARFISA